MLAAACGAAHQRNNAKIAQESALSLQNAYTVSPINIHPTSISKYSTFNETYFFLIFDMLIFFQVFDHSPYLKITQLPFIYSDLFNH